LRSNEWTSGVGLLKQEMRDLGSVFMAVADSESVPAGKALAVDRERFSLAMSARIAAEPLISLVHQQIASLDDSVFSAFDRVVVAAGPLASDNLSQSLAASIGAAHLYFYDAIAPIVAGDSLNYDIIFRASRYALPTEEDPGDYLNCPMNKDEYQVFYEALMEADKVAARDFEQEVHFEGCMPIEALAERGHRTLTFGPLKPVGFDDPRTGRRPWALVQLRAENRHNSQYNLVGCQTKLTYPAQEKVFRLIPGLEKAEFVRFGSMHRNTYVNAPQVLDSRLALHQRPHVHLAGQISGVEGYVESAACGLWVGMLLAAEQSGRALAPPPTETALGALLGHLRSPAKKFQPSNVHFGLMPELPERAKKADRKAALSQRARDAFARWMN
ncbi:MAG: methylenetetrahydrofolate--tRNA-(uracil(54)-C(5))-methyltransferase (FADH(2)-oxidizing) TrmFO, partial [Comamonas sp.]